MDTIFIFVLCISLAVLGIIVGWIARERKNQYSADGYLRFTIDETDGSWYPYLDLNYPIKEIASKRCAIFLIEKAKPQK